VNEFVINTISLCNYVYLMVFSLSNFIHAEECHDTMYFYTDGSRVNISSVSVSNLLPNSVFPGRFQCFSSGPPGK
jgi:hypothetical protein